MGGSRFVRSLMLGLVVVSALAGSALATGGGTSIPDVGVDMAAYITSFGTQVGTYLVVVIGLYFAFIAIRIGVKWARRAA